MSWRRLIACLVLGASIGCADGGQRGTGISSFEGNVVAVQRGAAEPSSSVSGIVVRVEGTSLQAETDAAGSFTLRGTFGGDTALRFQRASDGLDVRYSVNAPAGGTTTLHDVTVRTDTGEASPAAVYVDFEGRVVTPDCEDERLLCESAASSAADDDTYVVLLADSTVHDSAGHPVGCDAFQPGDLMHVHGAYTEDGTIGAADVTRR